MPSYFYSHASGQAGYCKKHSRYLCDTCKRAEERSTDWGVFEWRSDAHYSRGTAIKVFSSKKRADSYISKHSGNRNWVARDLERVP